MMTERCPDDASAVAAMILQGNGVPTKRRIPLVSESTDCHSHFTPASPSLTLWRYGFQR